MRRDRLSDLSLLDVWMMVSELLRTRSLGLPMVSGMTPLGLRCAAFCCESPR
jgi:hypothetical protein